MSRFTLRASVVVVLVALMDAATRAPGAEVPESDTWGEAVDGVQMSLSLATALPVLPGELPALGMQIRNRGSTAVSVQPEALYFAQIEVDGVWYAQDADIVGINSHVIIAPGAQSAVGFSQPKALLMHEIGAKAPSRFVLRPGSHRLRVRNLTEQRLLNVRTTEGRMLELVSNYVAIDVPGLAAGSLHEVPVAEATADGAEAANDDPDLTAVQVTSTRIRPPRAINCVAIAEPGIQRTPEQQAGMAAESPEVRHAMEAVDRHITADLARNQSMLRLHFSRFEDHGDEIWFIYNLEYPACVLAASHNDVTMTYNKETGMVSGRNP